MEGVKVLDRGCLKDMKHLHVYLTNAGRIARLLERVGILWPLLVRTVYPTLSTVLVVLLMVLMMPMILMKGMVMVMVTLVVAAVVVVVVVVVVGGVGGGGGGGADDCDICVC